MIQTFALRWKPRAFQTIMEHNFPLSTPTARQRTIVYQISKRPPSTRSSHPLAFFMLSHDSHKLTMPNVTCN